MCIFTGPVRAVSGTNIFARLDGGHQYLAYAMTLGTDRDVAMVLPLPVASHAENAVEFLSLEGYDEFFLDLGRGFPQDLAAKGGDDIMPACLLDVPLEVHEVGMYEASFVPTLADFGRLDPRFRLPATVWKALPQYADYGFAVFKLRATPARAEKLEYEDSGDEDPEARRHDRGLWVRGYGPEWAPAPPPPPAPVHPMAFRFPTRAVDRLFFPTVHVHDGEVHAKDEFDHHLFFQGEQFGQAAAGRGAPEASLGPAKHSISVRRTRGIVAGDGRLFRYRVQGTLPNGDIWITA